MPVEERRMGEAAHEFAREHLDARKTASRLVELYRALISTPRGEANPHSWKE